MDWCINDITVIDVGAKSQGDGSLIRINELAINPPLISSFGIVPLGCLSFVKKTVERQVRAGQYNEKSVPSRPTRQLQLWKKQGAVLCLGD